MRAQTIDCRTCGEGCADGITAEEKDPPGQLILMCDHTTVTFSLDDYDVQNLPPADELPDEWGYVDQEELRNV